MMLQLGPPPKFPPTQFPPVHHSFIEALGQAIPFLIAGSAVLAMLLVVLLRYHERFREFWSSHVCSFMEERSTRQCDNELMVERYLLNELTQEQREAVEAHVFECAKCAASMDSGLQFIETLKREAPMSGEKVKGGK